MTISFLNYFFKLKKKFFRPLLELSCKDDSDYDVDVPDFSESFIKNNETKILKATSLHQEIQEVMRSLNSNDTLQKLRTEFNSLKEFVSF